MRKEIGNYTPTEFAHDLVALGQEFAASDKGDSESILRHMRTYYTEAVAPHRAQVICMVFEFLIQHRDALEAADVLGPGSNSVPSELMEALYRWLALMPWREVVPAPPLETILRMYRGEE